MSREGVCFGPLFSPLVCSQLQRLPIALWLQLTKKHNNFGLNEKFFSFSCWSFREGLVSVLRDPGPSSSPLPCGPGWYVCPNKKEERRRKKAKGHLPAAS